MKMVTKCWRTKNVGPWYNIPDEGRDSASEEPAGPHSRFAALLDRVGCGDRGWTEGKSNIRNR